MEKIKDLFVLFNSTEIEYLIGSMCDRSSLLQLKKKKFPMIDSREWDVEIEFLDGIIDSLIHSLSSDDFMLIQKRK